MSTLGEHGDRYLFHTNTWKSIKWDLAISDYQIGRVVNTCWLALQQIELYQSGLLDKHRGSIEASILHNPVTLEFLGIESQEIYTETKLESYILNHKHEVMQVDDNPPIGLLLCTDYGVTTVQYATEGLSQNLFVSKYRLQLPSEDDIKQYLLENISEEKFKELKEEEENAE